MKKIFNNKLFIFLLAVFLTSGVVYAGSLLAVSIEYDNSNSNLTANNVQGAIDELYSKVINGGSGAPSEIINDFSITNNQLSGVKTTLSISNISTTDSSNIKGYIILLNDEVETATAKLPYEISLGAGRTYLIKIKAIDKDGKTKESTNTLSVTTPNIVTEPLEYPIITSNGWYNIKNVNPDKPSDYTYGYDPSVDCTASDALDKKAFDNNESTYIDPSSGKKYFYFGSDIYIYNVAFKIDATSGRLYSWERGNSAIFIGSESELYNGYYHTTYYGKQNGSLRNTQAYIEARTYEIKYDKTIP